MNIDTTALISGHQNKDLSPGPDDRQGLDGLMRHAMTRTRRTPSEQHVHRNAGTGGQDDTANETVSLPVKFTMTAPEIEKDDDDGELAMPSALPMQVLVYVDFPNTAVVPDTALGKNDVSARPTPDTALSKNDLFAGPAPDTILSKNDLAARPAPGTAAQSQPPVSSDHQGIAATTMALDTPASVPADAGFTGFKKPDEPARQQQTAHGVTNTTPVMTANVEPVSSERQPSHPSTPNQAPAPSSPADIASDKPLDRTMADGTRATGTIEHASSDSVEMTYRFKSWGPTESVSLKLDRVHPGAQMLAAASSVQVHKVLADALDQSRRGAKGQPSMRLTSDAFEDVSERADERSRQRSS